MECPRTDTILVGTDSLIASLETQIDTYKATIDQSIKYLIGSKVGAGGVAMALAVCSGGI
ncbi:hypothetical protein ACT7DZ_00175 [Bacillus cereus]